MATEAGPTHALVNRDEVGILCRAALNAAGASRRVAELLTEAALFAEDRGKSAVGVAHLHDYVDAIRDGRLDGRALPRIRQPSAAVIICDACGRIAHTGFDVSFASLAESARQCGVPMFAQQGSFTCGQLGWFTERLARAGLVALATAVSPALLATASGGGRVFGTNPWRTPCIDTADLERHRLSYRRHSAFHACKQALGASMLLNQHYRCHPTIANLASREFYGGELSVLTDIRSRPKLPERSPIIWADVEGKARRGGTSSWLNTEEATHVDKSIRYLLDQLPEKASIGVVTPFRDQARHLERTWKAHDRVQVGTVHTFQGGQQDVIVMSLVAAPTTAAGAKHGSAD